MGIPRTLLLHSILAELTMTIDRDDGASVHKGSVGSERPSFRFVRLIYAQDGALDTF